MAKKYYYTLGDFNAMSKSTLVENLGIVFTEMGDEYLEARMPVDERTIQPYKVLHGGAILALAETIGGALSVMILNPQNYQVKGMEINANHVRSVPIGKHVKAKASFLHKGNNTHIIQIAIRDETGNLVSICRLTNFLQPKEKHE